MANQVKSPGPAKFWENLGQGEVKVSPICGFHMIRELWLTTGMLLAAQEQPIAQPI